MTPLRRRMMALLVLVLSIAALAGACGIPPDSQAREIPTDAIPERVRTPPSSTTTTKPANQTSNKQTIYLVQQADTPGGADQLVPVEIDVTTPADPSQLPANVMNDLFKYSVTGQNQPLFNPIPKDTRVNSATLDPNGNILTLDLSKELIDQTQSENQKRAIAQIVYTATGISSLNIDGVRIRIDGQPTDLQTEAGTRTADSVLTRQDFAQLGASVLGRTPSQGSG